MGCGIDIIIIKTVFCMVPQIIYVCLNSCLKIFLEVASYMPGCTITLCPNLATQ